MINVEIEGMAREGKMKFPVWLRAMAWAVLIVVALMDTVLLILRCNR